MATAADGAAGDAIQNGNLQKRKPNHPSVGQQVDEMDDSTAATLPTDNSRTDATTAANADKKSSAKEKNGHSRRYTTGSHTDAHGKKPNKTNKPRSRSTNLTKFGAGDAEHSKRRYNSINKSSHCVQRSTNSMTSEGFVYDGEMELEEPFSDSEDDSTPKGPKKLTLTIPRGRIRTLSGTVPAVGYSPKWGGPTMCLSCLQFFDLPDHLQQFSEHLLNEHHIFIVEVGLIVDSKRYVEYWRQRFAKEGIDKIFPKKIPDETDELYGLTEFYYEMSEKIPEDYALRQKLAMRRLEEALACQQREREDTNFTQQCIFCRYTARGNRSKIIHHLYMIHHLNLGSPDNLVFVTEYIECLKEKLLSNECIYCEKRFSDRNTLMDHMRKRNHKEVNPKNHYYDKFYIINYLELGKRWLDVLKEDFEDTLPTFVDSDEEEEEESWQEWQEDNIDVEQTRVVCLFCEETEDQAAPLIEHIKNVHHFDILGIVKKKKLDVYDRMKMINFIRKENYNGRCFVCGKSDLGSLQKLRQHYAEENHLAKGLPSKSVWCTEENLVPLFGNDHLTWMLESFIDEEELATHAEKDETPVTAENLKEYLLKESEANTVEGVVAEDLPELNSEALADLNLYESLK